MALYLKSSPIKVLNLNESTVLFKDMLVNREPIKSYLKRFLASFFEKKGLSEEDWMNSRATYPLLYEILSNPKEKFFALFVDCCLCNIDINCDSINCSNCRLTYCEFYECIMGRLDTEFREGFWSCAEEEIPDSKLESLDESEDYVDLSFVMACVDRFRTDFQFSAFCKLLRKYGFPLKEDCKVISMNVWDAPWGVNSYNDTLTEFLSYISENCCSGLNDFSVLYQKGYNIIFEEDYSDHYSRVSLARVVKPTKNMLKLLQGSFKYKKHIAELSDSCYSYCETLSEVSDGFDASYIKEDDGKVSVYLAGKVDLKEGAFVGENIEACYSKEDFWYQDCDNGLVPLIKSVISPILKKYDEMYIEVDKIAWEYHGDPTIDWSKLSEDVVTVYESVSLVENDSIHSDPTYFVKFIMCVDTSKCTKDISVLRNMYSVYLEDEDNTEDIASLYKEKGRYFNTDVLDFLINTLRNTPKSTSISELGISDSDVLEWFEREGEG